MPSLIDTSPIFQLLRNAGYLTNLEPEFPHYEWELRNYQRYFIDKIKKQNCLIAIGMGLGKTATVLTAVRDLLRSGKIKRVLIVAPKLVARETWPDEIRDWSHFSDLRFAVCVGTEAERIAALEQDAEITTINRENVQWLWRHIGGKEGWKWDMLVYDESSRLKGFSARSQASRVDPKTGEKLKANLSEFGVLAHARSKIRRVVELTGTPSPNGIYDLGGQAYILDQGKRLGSSQKNFKRRWFDDNRNTYGVIPKPFAEKQIMSAMSDIMFSLEGEHYIDVPKIVYVDRFVNLSKKLQDEFKQFKKTMISDVYDVEACSRGVLTNKLLQFGNGSIYRMQEGVENPVRETIHVHDEKIAALESIVEETNGANLLIAYNFDFDLQRIKKKYPKAVVFDETPDFVQRWKRGEIRMGVAHPMSMGHGLNMQSGGCLQCWYGLTWSLEAYLQFNRRLARPGQKAPFTSIYRIITRNTMDETLIRRLDDKNTTQDRVTEAVRVDVLNAMKMAA